MRDPRALIGIQPDGTTHDVVNDYTHIREFVGNVIDFIHRGDGDHAIGMYIDDEALLRSELDLNLAASLLVQYPIYGPAIVCSAEPDGEGDTVPPAPRLTRIVETVTGMVEALHANAATVGQDLTVHPTPDTVPPPVILTGDDVDAFFKGDSDG